MLIKAIYGVQTGFNGVHHDHWSQSSHCWSQSVCHWSQSARPWCQSAQSWSPLNWSLYFILFWSFLPIQSHLQRESNTTEIQVKSDFISAPIFLLNHLFKLGGGEGQKCGLCIVVVLAWSVTDGATPPTLVTTLFVERPRLQAMVRIAWQVCNIMANHCLLKPLFSRAALNQWLGNN